MEMSVGELRQASLELVDKFQEISDSSFGVARSAKLLQSGVVEPMDRARACVYDSYRRQALQSTRRMIEALEKNSVWPGRLDQLRVIQAMLERGSNAGQSRVVVRLLDEI